jgi:uncharacterized RDD family membrane protein YckC
VTREARLTRARALQGSRAGFVSRVLAAALDVAVVLLAETAILAFVALIRWVITAGDFEIGQPRGVAAPVLTSALAVIYFGYLWTTTGRTLGEQILGLRTVTEHGSRVPWLRAYVRACLTVAFPVGLLWIVISRKNASVQDLLCRTAVIYDWVYRAPIS